jgi:alkylation response protein AidB-like acyl-CoA dehydrogenase
VADAAARVADAGSASEGAAPAFDRDAVARASAAAAELRGASERIEKARTLPPDVVELLVAGGFTRLCVPRSLGGPEAHPATLLGALEALATGDGSAAWCAMIASTSSVLAAYLEPEAARRVYGATDAISGGVFAPRGLARRVPGGFRATGRWAFGSGCQHAHWLMGGCFVEGEAGRELVAGGVPDIRLLLFPREEAKILDTWDVVGLAGTGSHDLEVRDLFVPDGYDVSLVADRPREAGPLYAFPVFGLLALGVAAVGLGIARRACEELAALAVEKTPVLGRRRLAERSLTQARVAEADGSLGGARAYLRETIDEAFERASAGGPLPLTSRARLRLAATGAARAAARVATSMYELGGGSAIYRASALQRCLRDAHVVTQHAMVAESTLELAGRVLLGLDADASQL